MKTILTYVLMGLGISTIVSCGPTTRDWNAYTVTPFDIQYTYYQLAPVQDGMQFNQAGDTYSQSFATVQTPSYEASYCDICYDTDDSSSESDSDDYITCLTCGGKGQCYGHDGWYRCLKCKGSGKEKCLGGVNKPMDMRLLFRR